MKIHLLLGAFAVGAAVTISSSVCAAETLRVATLAPKVSAWGRIFRTWQKAVNEKTKGALSLRVYYNGAQGMEDAMVGKIKTGQIDGAVVSSVGLMDLNPDVLALQLPGVLTTWKQLDRVRSAVSDVVRSGFKKNGAVLLSWADIGIINPYSRGFALRTPKDYRNRRPLVFRNDPTLPAFFQATGATVPVPMSVVEVLPALQAGTIDTLLAPAIAVEQLQWAPHVDHVTEWTLSCNIGGTVFNKKSVDDLSPEIRAAFLKIQNKLGRYQTTVARKESEASRRRLHSRLKRVQLSGAERAEWDARSRAALRKLASSATSRALVEKVAALAGKPL